MIILAFVRVAPKGCEVRVLALRQEIGPRTPRPRVLVSRGRFLAQSPPFCSVFRTAQTGLVMDSLTKYGTKLQL